MRFWCELHQSRRLRNEVDTVKVPAGRCAVRLPDPHQESIGPLSDPKTTPSIAKSTPPFIGAIHSPKRICRSPHSVAVRATP